MIWLDAHLSPRIAKFITEKLGHHAAALSDLNLQSEEDSVLFEKAAKNNVIFVSKDKVFAELVQRRGPPTHVIWLTCGNTTESRLKEVFELHLELALGMIEQGEPLVEISGE